MRAQLLTKTANRQGRQQRLPLPLCAPRGKRRAKAGPVAVGRRAEPQETAPDRRRTPQTSRHAPPWRRLRQSGTPARKQNS